MGDHPACSKALLQLGPEGKEFGSIPQILIADSVDQLSAPSDGA